MGMQRRIHVPENRVIDTGGRGNGQ
ncbi:MAG: hypothetical protein JWN58_1295, partial [Gammaproteobacteria bacterium]|nr:hypothetical protein [Gammaproteobacteria bacterium]